MSRTLKVLLIFGVLGLILLFGMNAGHWLAPALPTAYLHQEEVLGMDVQHQGKKYPLNYTQQKNILKLINRMVPVGYEVYLKEQNKPIEFDAILIYKGDETIITLKPVSKINKQLLFSVPEWNASGLMRETGSGMLTNLIAKTVDKD